MEPETYHEKLKSKMDEYAHLIYRITKEFPSEELYGITSQLRRASLSIVLNYVEGYARIRGKVYRNFLEMSYGSLKETKYLLYFSFGEKYMSEDNYKKAIQFAEDIGAMLWGILRKLQ
ncbi:MAG: four helix bundle protein [Candidatus Wildermuthbacteria bacterium]|nr:four helix bundle protein [Candidatus Wildermuthbacteria bacterium]